MRKCVLYIALSLDGYIADEQGSVDWIKGEDENQALVDTYSAFIKDVDTVIMGRSTYNQIVSELSPYVWPYRGMTSYVITHHVEEAVREDIKFIDADPAMLLRKLKQEEGKNIWICGGASIVNQLIKEDLIDVYHLTFVPIMLGGGTRLFEAMGSQVKLKLTDMQSYNGIIEAVYIRRKYCSVLPFIA